MVLGWLYKESPSIPTQSETSNKEQKGKQIKCVENVKTDSYLWFCFEV